MDLSQKLFQNFKLPNESTCHQCLEIKLLVTVHKLMAEQLAFLVTVKNVMEE